MKGKTLSNQMARRAVDARRQGLPHKLLSKDVGSVGSGEWWDETRADRAKEELHKIVESLRRSKRRIDAFGFDRFACETMHNTLELTPNLAASDGFWRWLAVEKLAELVEARMERRSGAVGLANYGVDARLDSNRMAILWLRADILYDPDSDDPYHLAKMPLHTDFLESGIIRPRYGWCRNLARAFARFQYRDPNSSRAYLHSTDANGIRMMYKRLRRLHSTVAFEFLSDAELREVLEEKSKGLKRA